MLLVSLVTLVDRGVFVRVLCNNLSFCAMPFFSYHENFYPRTETGNR